MYSREFYSGLKLTNYNKPTDSRRATEPKKKNILYICNNKIKSENRLPLHNPSEGWVLSYFGKELWLQVEHLMVQAFILSLTFPFVQKNGPLLLNIHVSHFKQRSHFFSKKQRSHAFSASWVMIKVTKRIKNKNKVTNSSKVSPIGWWICSRGINHDSFEFSSLSVNGLTLIGSGKKIKIS